MACSSRGCSEKVMIERHRASLPQMDTSSTHHWRVVVIVLIPILAIVTAIVVINYYCAKKKRRQEREKYFMQIPEPAESFAIDLVKNNYTDRWEVDQNSLHFESIVGEGAFGVVRKGHLETQNNTKIEVAVKMLKGFDKDQSLHSGPKFIYCGEDFVLLKF